MGVLPTTPPEGLIPWLIDQDLLTENLLIYKMGSYYEPLEDRKIQAVQLTCTGCGGTIYTDKVEAECCHAAYATSSYGFVHPETKETMKSNNLCLCPMCGTEVTVLHTSSVTENLTCKECYPLTVARFEDKLVLLGWCVRKWFTKNGDSGITSWPYEAFVVEQKGIVRLNAFVKYMGSGTKLTGVWEQRKQYYDAWGKGKLIYPWDPKILIGSTAENSKLDRLLKAAKKDATYPVTYLRLWQKRPNIENLVMQGASRLIIEAIESERNLNQSYYHTKPRMPTLPWVNWKQNSPSKMLGMTKDEYNNCLKSKWDVLSLKFWQEEKAAGRTLSADDMKCVQSLGALRCIEVRNTTDLDYLKVARYLHKQKQRDNRCDFLILKDYWRIARIVGADMSLPDVQFPPRLMAAHDRVEQMRQWHKDAEKAAERAARKKLFKERFEHLKALAWEQDGILIRPAKNETELKREGNKLHHCISSYAERHANGSTAIFFVRKADNPKEPWYTLEFDEKKLAVRQNRGSHNCNRTKEIQAFEDAWVAWLREQTAPKKKKRKKDIEIRIPVAIAG